MPCGCSSRFSVRPRPDSLLFDPGRPVQPGLRRREAPATRRRLVARVRDYPTVDVSCRSAARTAGVLLNTWQHVLALDYPRLTVYCLDDGGDETAAVRCRGVRLPVSAARNPRLVQEGGEPPVRLRELLRRVHPDPGRRLRPAPDFLREMLPYFAAEPDLGIVQTPQFFATSRRQNWLERGAGAVQELFYRVVQVSRGDRDAAICVGTCAVYRRAALDANGGTTLIEHSEDVHTGFDLRRSAGGCATSRSISPRACAPTTSRPSSVSSTAGAWARWACARRESSGRRGFRSAPVCATWSGFAYYVLTALAAVTTPLIPLTLTVFFPARVRVVNYLILCPRCCGSTWCCRCGIAPGSAGRRCRSSSPTAGRTYSRSWICSGDGRWRGRRPASGPETAASSGFVWSRWCGAIGTGTVLVGASLWQVLHNRHSVVQFAPMVALSLLYLATNVRLVLPVGVRDFLLTVRGDLGKRSNEGVP